MWKKLVGRHVLKQHFDIAACLHDIHLARKVSVIPLSLLKIRFHGKVLYDTIGWFYHALARHVFATHSVKMFALILEIDKRAVTDLHSSEAQVVKIFIDKGRHTLWIIHVNVVRPFHFHVFVRSTLLAVVTLEFFQNLDWFIQGSLSSFDNLQVTF